MEREDKQTLHIDADGEHCLQCHTKSTPVSQNGKKARAYTLGNNFW